VAAQALEPLAVGGDAIGALGVLDVMAHESERCDPLGERVRAVRVRAGECVVRIPETDVHEAAPPATDERSVEPLGVE
jgi:hypothetical protein